MIFTISTMGSDGHERELDRRTDELRTEQIVKTRSRSPNNSPDLVGPCERFAMATVRTVNSLRRNHMISFHDRSASALALRPQKVLIMITVTNRLPSW
jgi:hypothetical protein